MAINLYAQNLYFYIFMVCIMINSFFQVTDPGDEWAWGGYPPTIIMIFITLYFLVTAYRFNLGEGKWIKISLRGFSIYSLNSPAKLCAELHGLTLSSTVLFNTHFQIKASHPPWLISGLWSVSANSLTYEFDLIYNQTCMLQCKPTLYAMKTVYRSLGLNKFK